MKKIARWFITFFLMFVELNALNAKAYTISMTTKEFLNFEILDTVISNDGITIKGWAFINENQHYRNTSDHAIQLEFISLNGSTIVDAVLTNISMTSSYEQLGLKYCIDGVYFSTTCNYFYEYVGFTVTVPLSLFTKGLKYTTNLIFYAYNSKTYLKTPLYHPIQDVIQTKVGDYLYTVVSKLNDTQFRIIETPIYARKSPGKTGTIWATGTICSTNYSNKVYFKFGSVYTKILSRVNTGNQTYYEVKAKLDVCQDMRRRIIEGTVLTPVWISGMFVEYSGSPLEINSVLVNTKPVISAQDLIIEVGESTNLLDYAKCYDLEDGDISHKIVIESTDYINKSGIYFVTYYVEDKYGYFDRKTVTITVKALNNDPPVIYASNKTVFQYSSFDYLKDISAYDVQDGDLTDRLVNTNQIDTSIIGDQPLCYSVTDKMGTTTKKCITITVYNYQITQSRFRFVSKNNLFYNELIPISWIDKLSALISIVEGLNSIGTYIISPAN
jgi:hypothetical protein